MNRRLSIDQKRDLISAAIGRTPCETALRNGWVVNVFTGEITQADVGIMHGRVAVLAADGARIESPHSIDADGLFLAPGLIDSHMHLESTLLTPAEFARFVLPLGTTAAVIDPHEIANVAGARGVQELMDACAGLPLTFYFMIPPAVPASELETSGAWLDADDMAALAENPNVLGVAEAMDYPGVLDGREETLCKLDSMPGKVIDGHAPGLGGRELQAYVAAGISSDHESTNAWEGLEKLRAGMYLMIREGSAARDMDALVRLVDINTVGRCLLVTDDLLPTDLAEEGHINYLLSRAVRHGVGPAQALRMATLNAAQRFKLDEVGAIAPGYGADIAAFEDLADFRAAFVVAGGELVATDGEVVAPLRSAHFSEALTRTVHLPEVTLDDLAIPAGGGLAQVIGAVDGQVFTRRIAARPPVIAGRLLSDTDRDILKIVVVERHGKTGHVAVGLVEGFGLKSGAIAGSVAHDAHNVVAVGANDADIVLGIRHIGRMDGGLVAAADGKIIADLPLPVGGLISPEPAAATASRLGRLEQAARDLGCRMAHPFMTLSFMCLSVIPELKITDQGLVDVNEHRIVPLFVEERIEAHHAAGG